MASFALVTDAIPLSREDELSYISLVPTICPFEAFKVKCINPEDRLAIILEGQREGTTATCRKYNLAPSLYDRWKNKFLAKGVEGLKPACHRRGPEDRVLEEENECLKRIITKQALEIKSELELSENYPADGCN